MMKKFILPILSIILISFLGVVVWMNLTPGYFQGGGCSGVVYAPAGFSRGGGNDFDTTQVCVNRGLLGWFANQVRLKLAVLDFNRGLRSGGKFCLEVITPARSVMTGDCQEFPTTCLPPDYKEDKSCAAPADTAPSPKPSPTTTPPTESLAPLVINENPETVSWPVYKNESCAYTIKYPSSWTGQVVAAHTDTKGLAPDATEADLYQKEGRKEYPKGVLTIMCFGSEPSSPGYSKSELLVNGLPMTRWSKKIREDLSSEVYVIRRGSSFTELLFRYETGDSSKETFDKILSTFRLSK